MISLIWGTQISQTHRQKVEWWLPRAGERWGALEFLFKGYKVSVSQDESCSEDEKWLYGCITMWKCLQLNCVLKKCLILLALAAHILKNVYNI